MAQEAADAFKELQGKNTSASASTSAQVLPKGWKAYTDPSSGKEYYHNATTDITQWEHPGSASEVASVKGVSDEEPFNDIPDEDNLKAVLAVTNPNLNPKPEASKTTTSELDEMLKIRNSWFRNPDYGKSSGSNTDKEFYNKLTGDYRNILPPGVAINDDQGGGKGNIHRNKQQKRSTKNKQNNKNNKVTMKRKRNRNKKGAPTKKTRRNKKNKNK